MVVRLGHDALPIRKIFEKADICSAAIWDLLEQVLTNFCQQVARAIRLRQILITSRCSRYTFFPIQRM
jgi:hypothetical protein